MEDDVPDRYNLAYSIHFLLGAGYLVPWNAFITAIDYFELLYPSGQLDRVFSIVYMLPAFICILLLTFFGRKVKASLRANAGLLLFTAMLVLVPVMDVFFIKNGTGNFVTYWITVIAAALNGVADALVQGSIVGSTGNLPPRYMQALMGGTAGSGVLVSVLRLLTRAIMPQTQAGIKTSAYLYFIVSILIMIACLISYNLMGKLSVMQHYENFRVSRVESTALLGNSNSEETYMMKPGKINEEDSAFVEQRGKLISYTHVWQKIQGYALSVGFIYTVTLSIFPGHITEDLHSSFFGDWYAVLLTLCYNLLDLVGKLLPGVIMMENKYGSITGCVSRVLFYPLFYLCLHGPTIFQSDAIVMLSTCLLGLTNGYFTTVVMILGPKSVPPDEVEVAGFIMVMFLTVGLAAGSILEWVWVL